VKDKSGTPDNSDFGSKAKKAFVHQILGRSDFRIIGELIEPGSRVLDLGCGEGELLHWLAEHKNVQARGVELDATKVRKAIARGVMVYQGDFEQGLSDYPDAAFDYVILSQTLQQTFQPLRVLTEMLRVGKRAIVAFPNFAHWRMRWAHLASGRTPRTTQFPYDWYDSPNIHFLSIFDFEALARKQGWRIDTKLFLSGDKRITFRPNLLGEEAVFLLRRG
jgi:methionine biosynthesis protein MetW